MAREPKFPSQSPLIDYLLDRLELKNDAALSRVLGLPQPIVSRLRHGRSTVSAWILLKLHDATGLPLDELRSYIVNPKSEKTGFVPTSLRHIMELDSSGVESPLN